MEITDSAYADSPPFVLSCARNQKCSPDRGHSTSQSKAEADKIQLNQMFKSIFLLIKAKFLVKISLKIPNMPFFYCET